MTQLDRSNVILLWLQNVYLQEVAATGALWWWVGNGATVTATLRHWPGAAHLSFISDTRPLMYCQRSRVRWMQLTDWRAAVEAGSCTARHDRTKQAPACTHLKRRGRVVLVSSSQSAGLRVWIGSGLVRERGDGRGGTLESKCDEVLWKPEESRAAGLSLDQWPQRGRLP